MPSVRKRPIRDHDIRTASIPKRAADDLEAIAAILNAAAKPAGFPRTDPEATKRESVPLKVSKSTALAAGLALLRDMLDDGRIASVDLLVRIGRLEDIDPLEADRRLWEKIEREKGG